MKRLIFVSLFSAFFAANCAWGGDRQNTNRKAGSQKSCLRCGTSKGCNSSGCSVCNGRPGRCCYPDAPIDIDSLTPEAESGRLYEQLQAKLVFKVPEDADVYLSGQRMITGGAEREFLVAVNDQKKTYSYEVRVDVVRGGQAYFKKHMLKALRAGAIIEINVESPPVEEGELPEINLEAAPVVPGGPSADSKSDDAEDSGDEGGAGDEDASGDAAAEN